MIVWMVGRDLELGKSGSHPIYVGDCLLSPLGGNAHNWGKVFEDIRPVPSLLVRPRTTLLPYVRPSLTLLDDATKET